MEDETTDHWLREEGMWEEQISYASKESSWLSTYLISSPHDFWFY